MEVESKEDKNIQRGEIYERTGNIVEIHKNLRLDNIAVSRTITGESYLPLSCLVPNWPDSFPVCSETFSALVSRCPPFTVHSMYLETLRFHLNGMSFIHLEPEKYLLRGLNFQIFKFKLKCEDLIQTRGMFKLRYRFFFKLLFVFIDGKEGKIKEKIRYSFVLKNLGIIEWMTLKNFFINLKKLLQIKIKLDK